MATLLELVKDLAAMSGAVEPDNITTVVGVTDSVVRDHIRWIRVSNLEIERQRDDWRFRIKEGELELEKGVGRYDISLVFPDFKKILPYKHPQIAQHILMDGRQQRIFHIPYPRWVAQYGRRIASTTPGQPRAFTVLPDGQIELFPTPSKANIVNFDYLRKPQMMDLKDGCEPAMPDDVDNVILYHALRHYAFFDEASQRITTVQFQLDEAMNALYRDQLPAARAVSPGFNQST